MKDQFDVWRHDFPDKGGEHPVVLISHPHAVKAADLFGRRGRVTLERRRAIRQKIRDLFLLMDTD